MKILKYLSVLTISAGCILTACSETEYEPGAQMNSDGDNVYFSSDNETNLALGTDATEFTLKVERDNAAEAQSIPLEVSTLSSEVFTVPATVEFGQGELESTITVQLGESMELFTEYKCTISIAEDYTQQYIEQDTYPRVEVTVLKEDYVTYATGIYSNYLFDPWNQTLEYSEILDQYRLPDLWSYGSDVVFKWDGGSSVQLGYSSFETGVEYQAGAFITAEVVQDGTYSAEEKTFTFFYEYTVPSLGGTFNPGQDYFIVTEFLQ